MILYCFCIDFCNKDSVEFVNLLPHMTLKNQAIQTALEGNWQEAIAINKSLVQENPEDMDALNRLALAYTIMGKLKEAKSTYQKVLDLDPLNPIALRNLKKLKDKALNLSGGNFGQLH